MIPKELHDCLKKVLMLAFHEEPPYEYILNYLRSCFETLMDTSKSSGPPSAQANVVYQMDSYVFEWNRTVANRVRNALLAENGLIHDAVEVRLSPHNSMMYSMRSRDLNLNIVAEGNGSNSSGSRKNIDSGDLPIPDNNSERIPGPKREASSPMSFHNIARK